MDLNLDRLNFGEIHLWYLQVDTLDYCLNLFTGLLTQDEKIANDRFSNAEAKKTHLIARGASRILLSRYSGLAPTELCFQKNQYGRPHLDPIPDPPLHFNITHTSGMVVLAFARTPEIGVDIEALDANVDAMALAEANFSLAEYNDLKKIPEADQKLRFFHYWTLKEAYIKARGMGLSLPLEKFSFQLDSMKSIQFFCDKSIMEQPEAWQFRLFSPTPKYQLAVALRYPSLAVREYIFKPILE